MGKAKEPPAPAPLPSPKTIVEQEPDKIKTIDDLQGQARFNTHCLMGDVRRMTDLDGLIASLEKEVLELEEPVDEASAYALHQATERLANLRHEKTSLTQQIQNRRARAGAMVRRRNLLASKGEEHARQEREQSNTELTKRINLNDMIERRSRLEGELVRLAADAQQAQMKTNTADQRDLARRLMALQRACFSAQEALRRVPELKIVDEE